MVRPVRQDCLVHRVLQAMSECRELSGGLETLDLKDLRALQDPVDQRDPKDLTEDLVLPDPPA